MVQNPSQYHYYRPEQPVSRKKRHHVPRLFVLCLIIALFIGAGLFLKGIFNPASAIDAIGKAITPAKKVVVITPQQREQTALVKAWTTALSGHQGDVDIAVYDHQTGATASYSTTTNTFNTASIIKLSILETTLVQDQNNGTGLTADQLALATPMIENSDNDSATALWNDMGGPTALTSFYKQLGTTSSSPDPGGDWGLTQTTATDQLLVLNALAYPGKTLNTASAQSADTLLDNVESDQTWGVSAGSPSDVTVELKNGWLEDDETNDIYQNTEDWTVNSIGHIHGENQDYTIAVLSDGNDTEQDGINTIQNLATITWQLIANASY